MIVKRLLTQPPIRQIIVDKPIVPFVAVE